MTAQEYVKKFLEEHPDIYMEAIQHMSPAYQDRYNAAEEDLEAKGQELAAEVLAELGVSWQKKLMAYDEAHIYSGTILADAMFLYGATFMMEYYESESKK